MLVSVAPREPIEIDPNYETRPLRCLFEGVAIFDMQREQEVAAPENRCRAECLSTYCCSRMRLSGMRWEAYSSKRSQTEAKLAKWTNRPSWLRINSEGSGLKKAPTQSSAKWIATRDTARLCLSTPHAETPISKRLTCEREGAPHQRETSGDYAKRKFARCGIRERKRSEVH